MKRSSGAERNTKNTLKGKNSTGKLNAVAKVCAEINKEVRPVWKCRDHNDFWSHYLTAKIQI